MRIHEVLCSNWMTDSFFLKDTMKKKCWNIMYANLLRFTTVLLATLVAGNEEKSIFDKMYARISIPKNYQKHRVLPFHSPSLKADYDESFRLSLKKSEYSSAFTINPQFIIPGQQFDILIDDTNILNDAVNIMVQVEAKSNSHRGTFTLNINPNSSPHTNWFEIDEYIFEMPQRFRTGKIGTLRLVDGIVVENAVYSIYGSMANHFSLKPRNNNSVELISLECLSECHKIPHQFSLVVRATVESTKQTFDIPVMIILIDNSDGYQPRFKHSVIPLNMEEKSLMNYPLIMDIGNPDGANLTFILNDYDPIFEIDQDFGILSVRNYELLTINNLGERFNMSVSISDGKTVIDTTTITVTLMAVKNQQTLSPKFSHNIYAFAASPGESFVGKVSTQSLVNNVTYRIAEGGEMLFQINATDGRIFYDGSLDKNPRYYEFKVVVLDKSSPPQVDVALVQVLIAGLGSSPIKFETKESTLVINNKTADAGSILYQFVAKDADPNAKVLYSMNVLKAYNDLGNIVLDPFHFREHFRFCNNGINNGTLQLAESLKNTTIMAIWANIVVSDGNHPYEPIDKVEFMYVLVDPEEQISEADLVKFDQLRPIVEILENLPLDTYIYTANVKPLPIHLEPNRRIIYSLTHAYSAFAINPATGVITATAKLLAGSDYNLTVVAIDLNTQMMNMISMIVRIISSTKRRLATLTNNLYKFNVTENANAGTVVGTLYGSTFSTDVNYKVVGNDEAYFEIDKKGTIRTLSPLDFELQSVFHLVINVSRQNEPSTVLLATINVLDENDVEPRFLKESYAATVMENSPINTFIVNARAFDEDSVLEYSLMMNSESTVLSSLLHVNKDGSIYNVEPLVDLKGMYQFGIIARDDRHIGASTTVFLTVLPTSKCQPTFLETVQDIIYINENESPGSTLAHFKAQVSSSDCQVTYAIWNGTKYVNEIELFIIDAISGELMAKKSFDCEEHDRYSLTVVAVSEDLFAQLDIEVRVVDEDDNPIEIIDYDVLYGIREDEDPGLLIAKIRAYDRDRKDRVYFHLKNGHGKFRIGRTDGILKLIDKLDREENDFYELNVIVSNVEDWPTDENDVMFATVKIMVLDVNDNGPIFVSDLYMKAIPRDSVAGMKITKVQAIDPDLINAFRRGSDLNHYRIDETFYHHIDRIRQTNGFIIIDEKFGIVRLTQSPYDLAGGVFELKIATIDFSAVDSLPASTMLKVWVYDITHIVQVDIEENARNLNFSELKSVTLLLTELCACEILLFNVKYINENGRLLPQMVRAQFLFINRTNDALLPAEHAISIIDKKVLNSGSQVPKLRSISTAWGTIKVMDKSSRLRFHEAVFTFLLLLALIVFVLTLCNQCLKFLPNKEMYEDKKIATESLNMNSRYKPPPAYVKPVFYRSRENYPNAASENKYAIQEVKILIGVDITLKPMRLS